MSTWANELLMSSHPFNLLVSLLEGADVKKALSLIMHKE